MCLRRDGEPDQEQLTLFADRTSAATMRANQLRLYSSSIAYVLLHALRRLGLAGTELARAQCQTIRLTLLKIGARVRITVRKVWLACTPPSSPCRCAVNAHAPHRHRGSLSQRTAAGVRRRRAARRVVGQSTPETTSRDPAPSRDTPDDHSTPLSSPVPASTRPTSLVNHHVVRNTG